jgi:hypothetical protein
VVVRHRRVFPSNAEPPPEPGHQPGRLCPSNALVEAVTAVRAVKFYCSSFFLPLVKKSGVERKEVMGVKKQEQ